MDLSLSRKILSVVISAVAAVCTCVLMVSMLLSATLGSQDFLEKQIMTDSLVAECNAQLDAKYAVLAEETGIPLKVFQAAQNNYSTKTALLTSFRNLFGDEASELYNQNTIDFFDGLITEYFDAASVKYERANVENAAKEAARIFSEVVGLHHMGDTKTRLNTAKANARSAAAASAVILAVCSALLIVLLFSNARKACVYLLAGIAGGSFGTLLGTLLSLLSRVYTKLDIAPAVYQNAFADVLFTYFVYLALIAAAISLISYAALYIVYRNSSRKSERKLIF